MGLLYYRSEVNLLTCWVHHLFYISIVQCTIQPNVGGLIFFAYAPGWRCVSFPRIHPDLYSQHLVFIYPLAFQHRFRCCLLHDSYLIPYNRASVTGESYLPSTILAGVFPMHVMWFKGYAWGSIKRDKAARAAGGGTHVVQAVTVDAVPTQSRQNPSK